MSGVMKHLVSLNSLSLTNTTTFTNKQITKERVNIYEVLYH